MTIRLRARAVAVASSLVIGLAACSSAPPSAPVDAWASMTASRSGGDLRPKGATDTGVVTRVVDGDTVHVDVAGRDVTVRLIGINTPETVKPESPIECFGPESSDFAKAALTGQPVTLEYDETQGRTDRYGRTLAYLWLDADGGAPVLFNQAAVAGGYAYERQYGATPYVWRDEFRSAQDQARAAAVGLWSACENP